MSPGVSLKAADGAKAGPKPQGDAQHRTRTEWRQYRDQLRKGGGVEPAASADASGGPENAKAAFAKQQSSVNEAAAAAAARAVGVRGLHTSASNTAHRSGTAGKGGEGQAANPLTQQCSTVPSMTAQSSAQHDSKQRDSVTERTHAQPTVLGKAGRAGNAAQHGNKVLPASGESRSFRRATDDLPEWLAQAKPKPPPPKLERSPSIDPGLALSAAGGLLGTGGHFDLPHGASAQATSLQDMQASRMPLYMHCALGFLHACWHQ